MKPPFLQNKNGIAVLITLTVIVLLMAVVMELNRKVGSSMEITAVVRNRITLSHMTASAVQVGMAALIKDKIDSGNVDSLQEEWADPAALNALLEEIPFEHGKLALAVSDELGRIQVNALVKFPDSQAPNDAQFQMWLRFLRFVQPPEGPGDDDISPMSIVDSIKDWLDSGDNDAITGANGAESDYYQTLDPPYHCQNGPMRDVKELLLVKGVKKLLETLGSSDLIAGYLTVHGMTEQEGQKFSFPGKININTAPLPVLAALIPDGENPSLAQEIIAYRDEMSAGKYVHDLTNPNWYKSAPGLANVTIDPELLTVQSDFFRIEAAAELDGVKQTAIAVVQREKDKKTSKWQCRVLSWELE